MSQESIMCRKILNYLCLTPFPKTAYILEAVDEKLGLQKTRGQIIKELAGWMPHEEVEELRKAVEVFNTIHRRDWD